MKICDLGIEYDYYNYHYYIRCGPRNDLAPEAPARGLEFNVEFPMGFTFLNLDSTNLEGCMREFGTAAGLRNRCLIVEEILEIL